LGGGADIAGMVVVKEKQEGEPLAPVPFRTRKILYYFDERLRGVRV